MTPEEVVNNFIGLWGAGDVDGIVGSFTADAVYHNIPMDPLTGPDEIRGFIEGFLGNSGGIVFETIHQVSTGNVVMNERIDYINFGGNDIALKVMGVFEIEGDKIAGWRDYFDMAAFTGG